MKELNIDTNWKNIIVPLLKSNKNAQLLSHIEKEYKTKTIFPEKINLFNAFNYHNFENLKVVILGQDPYHNDGQAHGLSFSVQSGVKIPPSLVNIFKELETDLNFKIQKNGNLTNWAKQGVLLLNTILTVEKGKPMSHKNIGWQQFTDEIITEINNKNKNIVFMLWGSPAHTKINLIDQNKHLILKSVHPSPLSAYRGFFGCKHFSKCNDYLKSNNKDAVNWELS